MGEIRDNVRHYLGYYLALNGITQKELAEKLSVSPSAVTNWIKGKNSPDIESVARICDIFNISVVELFGTDGSNRYTDMERKIIAQYRKKPELQHAIHVLLDIED